jgi:signal transduction histidine kinase/ActR/RegA family two-component response regulator
LRQRLAFAICGTLAMGIIVFGIVAWNEVRTAAVETAQTRLEVVTRRIADILASQVSAQKAQLASAARDPAIRYLSTGADGEARDSAVARVRRADSTNTSVLAIQVWDADGNVIFTSSPLVDGMDNAARRALMATMSNDDSAAVGPFVLSGDTLKFATFGPIRTGSRPIMAWTAIWRRLSARDDSRSLTDLIGTHARLALGNATGDVWSDLNRPTAAPASPPGGARDTTFLGLTPAGERVLGSHTTVIGSPWVVAIEFPYSEVVGPIVSLARRLAIFGAALLLLGAFIAVAIARSLTRPIAELASASEGLRAGDYSRRVPKSRSDELGNLAVAFNTMADAIADARVKLQAHAQDVEERGAALSDALRENDRTMAELNAVLASAPVGFAFHDRDLRYVRVNDRLAAAIGRKEHEIIGRRPSDLLPGIGADIEEGLSRALATDQPVIDLELAGPSPQRGEVPREWLATMFPVRTGSDLVGVGSVLVDMSAYRGLERQFLQAQRMDAVGRLAGGIAHDFNNILTAIASFTEFAIRALPQSHAAVDDLVQVRQAVQRAAGLIRQLLAFSRQQVMQPVVLNLSDVVRNLVPMLRRLIPESVALHSFLDPDLWAVRADPVQIEQILVNLVVNARDAMPTGGTLTITTSQATLDEAYIREGHRDAAIGDYAVLSVSDSGVGMDAATKARVFEPFFTTKAAGQGTGLGLSTVYGIVKQSGGSIWLYSEPGRGTTVKIFLRRHDEPDERRISAETPAAVETKPALILLVEDDDMVRVATLKALRKRGHRVLEAVDGEAALSVIAREKEPIDLVITDLVMPRLGGRDLGERLRAMGNEAAILYMSGYTGDAMSQRALLDEGSEFLEKPFTPDRLVQKVDEILRNSRHASIAFKNDGQ